MNLHVIPYGDQYMKRIYCWVCLAMVIAPLFVVLAWQFVTTSANPDPISAQTTGTAAALDIGVLVFREGLECILVLAAITASMTGEQAEYRLPIAAGAAVGFLATLVTWCVAVRVLDDISQKISALDLQAGTGLLAVIVLLVVMNWFFHKMYWAGWISLHNRRKRELLEGEARFNRERNVFWGISLLGFSPLYREGVEVVLCLQSYGLKLGNEPVLYGVLLGLLFSAIVAVLSSSRTGSCLTGRCLCSRVFCSGWFCS